MRVGTISLACFTLLVNLLFPTEMLAQDRVERLLAELSNAGGPSGFETSVRAILEREMRSAGLETSTDGLGSIIGALRGTADGPRIMLAAHMDEVAAIVRYITFEGMVKFQPLGGWLDQALVDQRWTIMTAKGPLPAISGLKSVHVTSQEERNRVTPRDDVFLDVGAASKEEAEALGIRPGDAIVPASSFEEFAHGRYVGKALDDRVGCVYAARNTAPDQRARDQNSEHDLLCWHGAGGSRSARCPYSRRRRQTRCRNFVGGRYCGGPPRWPRRLSARASGGRSRDLSCRRTDVGQPEAT